MNDLYFSTLLVTRGMIWYDMIWYIIHSLLKGYLNSGGGGGGGGGGWINTKRQFRHEPNGMNNWHLRDYKLFVGLPNCFVLRGEQLLLKCEANCDKIICSTFLLFCSTLYLEHFSPILRSNFPSNWVPQFDLIASFIQFLKWS
jgi:hypothetical protein